MNNSITKALETLHVAANAIRKMDGITNVSVDNDNNSGEIIFDAGDETYMLKLETFED